jgi:membrane protein
MINLFKAIKGFAGMLRDAYLELRQHEPLQIAGAASFFAVFALPSILIILSKVFGIFGNSLSVKQDLLEQLSLSIDRRTIAAVSRTVGNVWWLPLNAVLQAAGFLFLLFVATTFFAVIKGSLNQLWSIRPKKDNGVLVMFLQRAKSVGVILFAGILIYIILTIETNTRSLPTGSFLRRLFYYGSAMVASMVWFVVIFRFFADGRPAWKPSLVGGIFAGLLFSLGKSALRLLLSYNTVHTIYGASSAMVMLLLFVFYSSLIFYYSACFIKVFSDRQHMPIGPTAHAIKYSAPRVERYG